MPAPPLSPDGKAGVQLITMTGIEPLDAMASGFVRVSSRRFGLKSNFFPFGLLSCLGNRFHLFAAEPAPPQKRKQSVNGPSARQVHAVRRCAQKSFRLFIRSRSNPK